jgi:hypothetical protein
MSMLHGLIQDMAIKKCFRMVLVEDQPAKMTRWFA